MSRERVIIVGAGLCGSLLAARLRHRFDVTVVEPRRHKQPLTHEIRCDTGGINTTINRGSGLGGTTNYWHNALVELDAGDLLACGLNPEEMRSWYDRAWELFLDPAKRAAAGAEYGMQPLTGFRGTTAHMVVPQQRANMWHLAQRAYPGDPVTVVEAQAHRLLDVGTGAGVALEVVSSAGRSRIEADRAIICAGGLGTPVLLARSFERIGIVNGGYHDHPMAYVGKIRLRNDSNLRRVSGVDREGMSIRTGFVYEHEGIKAAVYLRPAIGLGLRSITGNARYILSDLRNDPFSPRKILQLLANPEAIREALLFKTGAGLRGEYFSLLLLGEQHPESSRGVTVQQDGPPTLNWHVTDRERAAYTAAVNAFVTDFDGELVAQNLIPTTDWEFRTAAHHSGGIGHFVDQSAGPFAVTGWPGVDVCDGSILAAGGIANSGLTLTALSLQLAHQIEAGG